MNELLTDFPIIVETPVIWGDMDTYGHINNTVYFRYFETARMAFFEELGFSEMKIETGIGPILASTQCRFRLPLTYPDTVSIGARITDIKEDRFSMLYRIVSHEHGKVAAEGEALIVTYDYNAKEKAKLPATIQDKILLLENTTIGPISKSD